MKVLLVTSPHLDHTFVHQRPVGQSTTSGLRVAQTFVPMGLISVRSAAAASDTKITIADLNKAINAGAVPLSRNFYADAAEWLLEYHPDLVGFMTEADSYHHVVRILQLMKQRRPGVLGLVGGVHASAVHEDTIRAFPWIDYVIRGEGELPFQGLLRELRGSGDCSRVGNLTYRKGDSIVTTAELPLINDLDTLPWPDCDCVDLQPEDCIFVEIGRGCPFRCNFCFTAPYWHRKHRIKTPFRIIKELRYFIEWSGRTDFNFTHDLFTTDRGWVLNFCKQLGAAKLGVTWTCSSRTDTLDEEQIWWLKSAGCRNIYFGVETGTAEMQKKIQKDLDLEYAKHIIGKTVEAGIGVTVGFIAGLPGEDAQSLRGTLAEAISYLKMPDSTVHLFGFSPYRGSANFPEVAKYLQFDEAFVDFPLPREIHSENRRLMKGHLELFSRYSWLEKYEGLGLDTLRAGEEFFPMANALRPIIIRMVECGTDPLTLLESWAAWIRAQPETNESPTGQCYGTINQFLEFIRGYIRQHGPDNGPMWELLRWEQTKNNFRTQMSQFETRYGRLSVISSSGSGLSTRQAAPISLDAEDELISNPTVLIEEFRYAPKFVADVSDTQQPYAFYRTQEGVPQIVKINELHKLILFLARDGIRRNVLESCLSCICTDSESQSLPGELITTLQKMQLLLRTEPSACGRGPPNRVEGRDCA